MIFGTGKRAAPGFFRAFFRQNRAFAQFLATGAELSIQETAAVGYNDNRG